MVDYYSRLIFGERDPFDLNGTTKAIKSHWGDSTGDLVSPELAFSPLSVADPHGPSGGSNASGGTRASHVSWGLSVAAFDPFRG